MQNCLAVILAAGRGSRMFPLSEETPKSLLPVCNKPLIWYTLQFLQRGGFQEAVIVVREKEGNNILEVVNQIEGVTLSLLRIPDSEDWGTADSLRFLREKGKLKTQHTDVLVISCDLITSLPVHLLIEFHSCHQSTLTVLLAQSSCDDNEPQRKPVSTIERDVIALAENNQLVYFAAQADLDESLTLSRSLLKRYPHMTVSSRLRDAHLYLVKKWILDYLLDNRTISSMKGELVPHLVRNQWAQMDNKEQTKCTGGVRQVLQRHASACVDETEQLALNCSSFSGYHGTSLSPPFVLCHALKVSDQLCIRVNSIPTYLEANRLLSSHDLVPQPDTQRNKGVSGDCCVGDGVLLGDKISIKHSTIGNHCHIGDKSKITHCVLMDHVNIGESVVLHGCVICSQCRIGDKSNLKDCLVGTNFTVPGEADIKGETLVAGGGLHI